MKDFNNKNGSLPADPDQIEGIFGVITKVLKPENPEGDPIVFCWTGGEWFQEVKASQYEKLEVRYIGSDNPQLDKKSLEDQCGQIIREAFGGRVEVRFIDGKIHNVKIEHLELLNGSQKEGKSSQ